MAAMKQALLLLFRRPVGSGARPARVRALRDHQRVPEERSPRAHRHLAAPASGLVRQRLVIFLLYSHLQTNMF